MNMTAIDIVNATMVTTATDTSMVRERKKLMPSILSCRSGRLCP